MPKIEQKSVFCERCRMPGTLNDDRVCGLCEIRNEDEIPPPISWRIFFLFVIVAAVVAYAVSLFPSGY